MSPAATVPSYGSDGAAGLDMYASASVRIAPGEWAWVDTEVAVAIPNEFVGIVKSRSSMASKGLYTEAGVIDSDYRGHVKIHLRNQGTTEAVIEPKMKIAQMIVIPVPRVTVLEVTGDLEATSRGTGGFGSTGEY